MASTNPIRKRIRIVNDGQQPKKDLPEAPNNKQHQGDPEDKWVGEFEIRSLPILPDRTKRRYPVAYLQGRLLKLISLPIGSPCCSSDCYTHHKYPRFENSIKNNQCPCCKKSLGQRKCFIDVGLGSLIRNYRDTILTHQYGWVTLNSTGSIIKWEVIGNPLIDSLSKYVVDRVFETSKEVTGIKPINYLKVKELMYQSFYKLNICFRQIQKSHPLTWCRGSLRTNEQFHSIIINPADKPHQFIEYQLVDELGITVDLDGKATHIHYIPSNNILLILTTPVKGHNSEVIQINIVDLTDCLMKDSKKLFVIPCQLKNQQFKRFWFSTCLVHEEKGVSLYVCGGSDRTSKPKEQTFKEILKWNNLSWDGCTFSCEIDKTKVLNNFILNGCSMVWHKKSIKLAVGAGFIYDKDQFKPLDFLFLLSGQISSLTRKMQNKFGAYSTIIEVPKVKQHHSGLLIFGGAEDKASDRKREALKKVVFWDQTDSPTQKKETVIESPCSNENYPFLFDNSSVLTQTKDGEYLIRMLIPARQSSTKEVKAYLLEYNIQKKSLIESALTKDDLQ